MPLLQPIAGRAHYIPGSNNLGVIATGDGGAIAIDTGLDKDTGRLIIFASAVAAHLTYLEGRGLARATLEDEGMIWQPVSG